MTTPRRTATTLRLLTKKRSFFLSLRLPESDIVTLNKALAERFLALLHKQELITDDDVLQILSQDRTGFLSVASAVSFSRPELESRAVDRIRGPFHDDEGERFAARYSERAPLSIEKLSVQDNIAIDTTKDRVAHEFDALEFLGFSLLRRQPPMSL